MEKRNVITAESRGKLTKNAAAFDTAIDDAISAATKAIKKAPDKKK